MTKRGVSKSLKEVKEDIPNNTKLENYENIYNAFVEESNKETLDEIKAKNSNANVEFDLPKGRHISKYKHRENTKTQDICMEQTLPDIDKELEELEELIRKKQELSNKKKL